LKQFLVTFVLIASCASPQARSNQYYETVAGHIVQTVLSGECNSECIKTIINSDLKYATYAQAMYVIDLVSKKLPRIFDGAKRELSIKVEEKYKRSVVK
jgi:hypothetical protein